MRQTVLVVDDEASIADGLRLTLEAEGMSVRLAGSVRTALAAVAQTDVHVAIVDLMLPDGDGLTLTKELKARDPAIEVIVITAYGSVRKAMEATKGAGAFHVVEKPVGFNFIDNPPRQGFDSPPLIGDGFALSSNLLTTEGAHSGTLEATCTVTRGGKRPRGSCYGLFALKGGQIAAMGLLSFTETTHIAVVGGTGVYEGVTGSITSVSRGGDSLYSDDTVHLIWP